MAILVSADTARAVCGRPKKIISLARVPTDFSNRSSSASGVPIIIRGHF